MVILGSEAAVQPRTAGVSLMPMASHSAELPVIDSSAFWQIISPTVQRMKLQHLSKPQYCQGQHQGHQAG